MINLFQQRVYVQIFRSKLVVRVLHPRRAPQQFDDSTCVILRRSTNQLTCFGREAETLTLDHDHIRVNAFDHPRLIVSEFELAVQTLMIFISRTENGKTSLFSSKMVVHVREPLQGGVTDIEMRVLTELGTASGANDVIVLENPRTLSDEEVMALNFRNKVNKSII